MTHQITLQTDTPQVFEGLLLTRRLVAAHLHSMHPANRPNRPAALGPGETKTTGLSNDD